MTRDEAVERKAMEALKDVWMNLPDARYGCVRALSRAGLLRTDLHERALELARAVDAHYAGAGLNSWPSVRDALALFREALAAEKPKERYYVYETDALDKGQFRWAVLYDRAQTTPRCGEAVCYFGAESDARAYADQKNREEAAR